MAKSLYIVRENSEDFYIGLGSRFQGRKNIEELNFRRSLYKASFKVEVNINPENEIAYQVGTITGRGAERVIKYGFNSAKEKNLKRVTIVHKANVLTKIYGLWIEKAEEIAKNYPDIELEFAIADAISM